MSVRCQHAVNWIAEPGQFIVDPHTTCTTCRKKLYVCVKCYGIFAYSSQQNKGHHGKCKWNKEQNKASMISTIKRNSDGTWKGRGHAMRQRAAAITTPQPPSVVFLPANGDVEAGSDVSFLRHKYVLYTPPFSAVKHLPPFDWHATLKLFHSMGNKSPEALMRRKYKPSGEDTSTMLICKDDAKAVSLPSILSCADTPVGYWTMHLGGLSSEAFAAIVRMAPPAPLLRGFLDTQQVFVFVSNCPLEKSFVLPAHTDHGGGPLAWLGGEPGSYCELELSGLSPDSPVTYSVRLCRKGDSLHIPARHWHCVRSAGCRICISYFTNAPDAS